MRFLLILIVFSSCKPSGFTPGKLVELMPRPSGEALWGACSEIPVIESAGERYYEIGGVSYRLGQFLGEGGTGKVYGLNSTNPNGKSLVMKKMKEGSMDDAYMDLLFHSTMEIIGVPTTKVGFGYILDEAKNRDYILVKERIHGVDFDQLVFSASLESINFLSPSSQSEAKKILTLAGQAYSRVINSGVYISDMHSRNSMWDEQQGRIMLVDGNIEPNETADSIDISNTFGRAIGALGWLGNQIFYDRYYNPDEKSSDEARQIARARIALYYNALQKECLPPTTQSDRPPYIIDVHEVFGG